MQQDKAKCPSCGEPGKGVEIITVRALVNEPKLVPSADDTEFRFCSTPGCSVVYYSKGPEVTLLHVEDLNVRVGQKKPGKPTPVCYCFQFSAEQITKELRETGVPSIPEKIKAEMKAGNCFCETSNPSGKCCLGNVQAVVRSVQEKME